MSEILTEMRICRVPLWEYSDRRPFVGFDPKDALMLPCSEVYTEFGEQEPTAQTLEVPLVGCLKQRKIGLCPRGLEFKPEELQPRKV